MKMHWVTGKINLSGQGFTILHINEQEPISWPEAQVLMALHGEENVYDLKPCATTEITGVREEKNRLASKYDFKAVEQVFPGHTPRMETLMPGEAEHVNGNGPGPDDDEDDGGDEVKPPEGAAVFKPGRNQPPLRKDV